MARPRPARADAFSDPETEESAAAGDGRIRIDKWLWFARFFKTRALAARLVSDGKVRVNGQRISRPGRLVGPGDVLTFPQARVIRLVRVLAPGTRRGPASEAQALYHDLDPPQVLPDEGETRSQP